MNSFETYQADSDLEKDIQLILQNKSLRKKEKRKLLMALQEQSCNAHVRSHVQYYLDLIKGNPSECLLTALSICSVLVIALYAAFRLMKVL